MTQQNVVKASFKLAFQFQLALFWGREGQIPDVAVCHLYCLFAFHLFKIRRRRRGLVSAKLECAVRNNAGPAGITAPNTLIRNLEAKLMVLM